MAALIAAASRSDMRVADARGYQAHTPKRGEERPDPPPDQRWPARRWIIERSFAWKARFRRLARDYERLPQIVAGLHFVACLRLLRALREVPSNHG